MISGAEAEGLVLWLKASLVRAVKTAAQSAVAAIGTTVLTIGQVDWRIIGGTAALSARPLAADQRGRYPRSGRRGQRRQDRGKELTHYHVW